jgi:gliding motility-associated-like protein
LLKASVDSPVINCISISDAEVQIQWEIPADPLLEFVSYKVYFRDDIGSTYSLVGTVSNYNITVFNYSLNSFTGTNAFFYITTVSSNGESAISNVIAPISLSLDKTQEAVAFLTWTSPEIIGAGVYYEVFKRRPGFGWQQIATVSELSYIDSIAVCSDSIYYKIELPGNGCVSSSDDVGELFEDNFPPTPPILDSISLDPSTGNIHVGWQISEEGDVGGYLVALKSNGNWILDTIWGRNNTYFLDTDAEAFNRMEEYTILAFDTCVSGNTLWANQSSGGTIHKSIFLKGESDACTRSITLNWNEYEGFQFGVGGYDVYVSEDNGQSTLLSSLGAGAITFTHDGLVPNANYCYTVVVNDGTKTITSSSNRICITMEVPRLPKNHYLNKVTVIDNSIEISCFVDNDAAIEYYLIERAKTHDGVYEILDRIDTPTDTIITYLDENVDPNTSNYYYKIVAVDVCGYGVNISNISTNVLLQLATKNGEFKNSIKWNPYSDWDTLGSGVAFYNIYKGYSPLDMSSTPFAMVGADINAFEDEIEIDRQNEGEICYYIEAVEGGGNLLAFKERSFSNIKCVSMSPTFYVPSAFTPNNDLKNDVFQPILNFVPSSSYYFAVFSRYGRIIFETTNPDQPWTGDDSPTGVYTYKILFTNTYGNEEEDVGAVTLIK